MIPAVKLKDSFAYLLKEFCYNLSYEYLWNVKFDLVKELRDYLEKIDILSFHPKHKINILTKFACNKLRWDLPIYYLPETWIVQNLDNKANRHIHKWLGIPISGNVNHLHLKVKQLGIKSKPKYRARHLKVFEKSKYDRMFWMNWHEKHSTWRYHKRSTNAKIAKWTFDKEIQNEIITSMNNLKQNTLMWSLQQSFKIRNKKLEFIVQYSNIKYFQILQKSPYFLPQWQQ